MKRTLILLLAAAVVTMCCWAAMALEPIPGNVDDGCCGGQQELSLFCCKSVTVRHKYTGQYVSGRKCVSCLPGEGNVCLLRNVEHHPDGTITLHVFCVWARRLR